MSDHLVRVGHLKALQKARGWSDSDLARYTGRTPQQVYSWFKPTTAKGVRLIGERLARSLEEKLGLPRYYLDDRVGLPSAGEGPPTYGVSMPPALHVTNRVREMPVITWAQVHSMLEVDNEALQQSAPHLETFALSSDCAKFVAMPDDSMAPDIQPGDHLLFDPKEVPRAGDIVLVRVPSDEYFVRLFRPRTAYSFEAVALNGNYQPLTSPDDGVQVAAVMVEHRRYRRAR